MDKTAVILCGGRARRLGAISDEVPKALVQVHEKPILWYIILKLYTEGFRHFILPLGYKADQIRDYIDHNFSSLSAKIDLIDTGEGASIGERISKIKPLITSENFLLINGDTIFDFPVGQVFEDLSQSKNLTTLISCQVYSQYGLLSVVNNEVIAFDRDLLVDNYEVASNGNNNEIKYRVNSGISVIKTSALDIIPIENCNNFEREFYGELIKKNVVGSYHIDEYWFAIDTPKDLFIINELKNNDPRAVEAKNTKLRLSSEYPEYS
ncbi:MAG: NDP-sugar synthase [Gammaproteobacteria bacterium]